MEEWRDVKGYEGLYQVSNEGRIKSLERDWTFGKGGKRHKDETIMKLQKSSRGYNRLILTKDGVETYKLVHRLVAEAFIENPQNLPQVNHKDENKTNNFVFVNDDGSVDLEKSNLEWCDQQYNNTYNDRHLKAGLKISKSCIGRIPWNKGLKLKKHA